MTASVFGLLGVILGMVSVSVGLLVRVLKKLERIEDHLSQRDSGTA